MKKSAVAFLITLCIVIAGLLTVSCNSAVKEEFGTVVLDFGGGGTRALDSNHLPVLNDSRILIKGAGSLSGPFSKEFSSAQGVSLSFPIGDEVTLRVSVLNPSARWSSAPQSFTVEAGTNAVSVKLSKKISGLNNLLFTQTKVTNSQGVPSYSLTLHMDGKTINVLQSANEGHIFSRDSKGRLYVGYKANEAGDPQKLVRYTSEGELDGHPVQAAVDFLANDYTTGKMYGASVRHLMEIKEDLSLARVTSGYDTGLFAVDNGRVIYGSWGQKTLTLSKIGSTAKNEIRSDKIAPYARHFGIATGKWMIKDLFIRGDYLYILFSSVEESDSDDDDAEPTLGAVLKWKLGTRSDGLPDIVGEPILIGKMPVPPLSDYVVLPSYYKENFYGAVKVIGFDDENLYIADDGFDAADTPAGARVVKNRNRVAALNMETNELTFTDAGPAKWNNEWKEWKAPNTKTIVWNKTHDEGSFKRTTFTQQGSSHELFETESNENGLFAFDQSGILYIPYKDVSNNKIKRFMQKDNGTYEEGEEFAFPTPSHLPGAMAVDTSRSHRFTAQKAGSVSEENYYNVLYCTGGNNDINRFVWTGDFSDAFKDDSYRVTPDWRITALAANKDGLFVALWKSETPSTGTPTYGIKINRYDKVSKALLGTVVLVPEGTSEKVGAFSINEKITDMHIQDGVLYAVTAKEMKEDSSSNDKRLLTSGKLWYISSTADFGDNKRVLYKSPEKTSEPDTLEKNFAPLRFIAVKPKKLVIASDGYYGEKYDWHCIKNFDKVFTFDIGSWNSPVGEPVENTTFTKVLTVSAEYEFLP